MRWLWQREKPTPRMPVWLREAHCHALLVATIAELLQKHPETVDSMRGDLLARARALVEVLKVSPVTSRGDNVLLFARKVS